jgi:hypothetical protein
VKVIVVLFLLNVLYACKSSRAERVLSTTAGITYELLDFGDDELPIGIGQYISLHQQVLIGDNQELFVKELNNQLQLLNYSCKDGSMELFELLYSGDSVHAMVTFHQLLMCGIIQEIPKNSLPTDVVQWRFRIRKIEAFPKDEIEAIDQYDFISNKWKAEGDSIFTFYKLLIAFRDSCDGEKLNSGNKIKIVHKTTRLDGSIIEYSTFKQPFEFILGQQGQVIEGIQIALGYMCKGQRVRVLIPSEYSFSLAFREQIETYDSPIIAEIEVLK